MFSIMCLKKDQRGITLIETMMAIAMLAILLPVMAFAFTRLARESSFFNVRQRLDSGLALTYSELSSELASAQSFNVSGSTWGVNPSSFSFVDDDGETITIDCIDDTITLPGGDQTVKRLRWTRGVETQFLTDSDINVTTWIAQVARDGSSRLSGINITVTFSVLNKEDAPYKDAESSLIMTIAIPSSVSEL
ncbi:MAG: prepilin-type N-terminal cleavage/methylation domain-containing protein [Patescibacteria group bacterium]|jgi:type II secretory pathway pseudopilin PulG